MKHLEEKILAYLDGSLADTEREEVLREVSASPEGRRMLEEHLRVGSLLTQAAKPTSAPLDAQRALASKLPMMVTYLPYLAPQSTRKTVGAWYRSTKYVTAMIGGAAVIGGALWFVLSNSNSSSESHSLPLAAEHGLVTPNNTQNSPSTNSTNNSGASTTTNTPAHAAQHNATQSSVSGPSALNASNATSNHSAASMSHSAERHNASHTPAEHNAIASDHNVNVAANRTTIAQATQQINANAVKQMPTSQPQENAAPSEPLATPLHAVSVSNAAAQRDTHYEIPHFIAERQSSGYIPLRFFANVQERYASLRDMGARPAVRPNDTGVSNADLMPAFEAELAYEVSPWVSVGLRGGQASFYRMQERNYQVTSGDLIRTFKDAFIDRISAPWLGLSVRYEFNPEDIVRVAATAVGGAAFIPNATSPMASLELSGTYNIWSFLALEAAASVDGSKVMPSYQQDDANKPGVIGYITTGPQRTTITTTAFGARVGLVFHP